MRGPHGITVDAFRGNVIATAAFDSVIQAEEDNPSGDEYGYQEPEQQATGMQRRPDGAIQHPMIRLEIRRGTTPHNLENRRHRALPWSKDSAGEEDFDMRPHGARKNRCKDSNGTAKGDRQGEHGHPFRTKRT
jgi:hypothetical protein